ncbi:SMI1/KNR4 family protein [Mucilaginibacter sp.]
MNLTEVIQYLKDRHIDEQIELRPGVSEELIKQVEQTYKVNLPDDIKQFYRFCNGFDTYDWMFNLIPMEDMIEQKVKYRYNDEPIPLAEYLIYSETWHLKVSATDPIDYYITVPETQGKGVLTRSLAAFIERFLKGGLHDEGGLLDWVKEL